MRTTCHLSRNNFGRKYLPTVVMLVLAFSQHTLAEGERSNIRGAGMARTFVATSRGLDAVGINPANLAFPDRGKVTVSIFPLGVHLGSDFLDYSLYTDYFTGVDSDSGRVARNMNDQDKQRVLDAFGSGSGLASAGVESRLFGVSVEVNKIGTFAFTVTEQVEGFFRVPRDYIAFLLNGNPPGSTLDFKDTDVKVSWMREYALTFGRAIPRVLFFKSMMGGVAVKLLHGYGYYEVQRFNTMLTTADNGTLTGRVDFLSRLAGADQIRSSSSYQLFPEPAATGVAFDLGINGAINDFLSFGMSLTDIGSLQWKKDVEESYIDTTLVIDDPLLVDQRDAVENALKSKKRTADFFYSTLPTQLRLGFAVEVNKIPAFEGFPGTMLVSLDYNQGFTETPGSTTRPRISLGVEYAPLRWLPLRTGISFGGTDRFNLAFGFGVDLGAFQLDLGSENVTWLFAPKSFSYGSFAMGMRLRF